MGKKILIVLDGAHISLKELPAIEGADIAPGDEVLLLGVLTRKEVVRVPSDVIPEATQEENKMLEASKDLQLLGQSLHRDRGCSFSSQALMGDPVKQAVAFARQKNADSILVAMKEPGGLGKLFSKGAAQRLEAATHLPVKALEDSPTTA